MQKVHEHILPFDYEKMKAFTFDESKGVKPNTEIVPPPRYSHLPLPFNYSYRQNPSVKQVVDELGNTTTINIHAAPKIWNQPVPFDVAQVPNGPADIPPVETLPLALQRLIGSATRLMEDRPIFTRRALMNSIPGNDWERLGQNMAKHIYQYVGYMFASGPWRDGIVKFGVDPRKDPECRKYQTMMFMLEKEPKDNRAKWVRIKNNPAVVTEAVKKKKESHLFDGQTVSKDGKIQSDGWYHNGTWAKAKIFMKHKISDILEGRPPKDASYTKVAREMPDVITRRDKSKATLPKEATSLEVSLATSIRAASLSNPLFDAQEAAKQVQDYEEEENEDREDLGRDDEEHEKDEGEGESEVDDDREDLRRDEEEHEEDEGEEESEVDEDDIDVPIDPMIQMIDPRLTEAGAELGRLNDGSEIAESIGDGMEIDDAQL
ncbi:general transcription factor 3C polypeptide 5 (transcription factor C subunit 1), partial [Lecanoromycetidae sp. Uapishka_2]